MSAPTKAGAEVDQPTMPLPISATPNRGGCRSSESGVWLVPANVLAAIGTGTVIRVYLAAEQRFTVVLVLLVGLLVVVAAAFLCSRVVSR